MRIFHIRIDPTQHVFRRGLAPVTLDTPAHRQRLRLFNPIHLSHIAVTGIAGDPGGNMHLMREANMIRKLMDTDPLNGAAFRKSFSQLLNIRTARFDHRVAI